MSKEKVKNSICLIFALLGVLDIGNVLKLRTFHGLVCFIAVIMLTETALAFLNRKADKKELKFLQKLLLIVSIIEATVFQFNSYHLLFGNYPELTLNLSAAQIVNFDLNSHENISSGETSFEFTGIDTPIGTLTFEAESSRKSQAAFYVAMSDDTHSAEYRNNIANAVVLKENVRSQTVPCNFSGNVHNLKINFYSEEGEYIHVDNIVINRPVYFRVSLLRMAIFLIIGMAVYLLNESDILRKSYADNQKLVRGVSYTFTVILVLAGLWITNLSRAYSGYGSIADDFRAQSGNQISQELVDAFEAGHTYLNTTPSEALLALENPYDGSQRNGVSAPWDHLLYNGKIYSYYGIAPVILLFLPYHVITGYYFPAIWAIYLFCCIGVIFMTKFYLCFIEKFFSQIRTSLALTGLFIMQLTSGIWYCFGAALFYEIAQSSGFAATMTGAYFLLSSNVIGDGDIKKIRLALSSVFLSLGVLCRPTLAVYCMCAMLLIFGGFLKLKKSLENSEKSTKSYVSYFLCALVPYAVIGGAQMIYNYVRFGSVTDFGIQYSLTINDFTRVQYHTHFVLIGVFSYLFQFPAFMERFPFFDAGRPYLFNPQGYYFIATSASFGLLWRAPELLAYGKAGKAYQLSANPYKKLYALILLAVSILSPAAILFSIWSSGYGARYSVDFAWQILLGALVIAFLIYQHCQENMKRFLNRLMTASGVTCLILFTAQTYNWFGSGFSSGWQSFGRLFEFWI